MNPWAKAAVQGAACGLMIGTVLLIGGRVWRPAVVSAQATAVAEVVRARSFEVVDTGGRVRAELSATSRDGHPELLLFDALGRYRAQLTTFSDGNPSLMLFDTAGKQRAELTVYPKGGPWLALRDAAGKERAILGGYFSNVVRTGEQRSRPESSLVLCGEDGKVIWEAP